MDKFVQVYTEELAIAVEKYPAEYLFPQSEVPNVVSRMTVAFKNGSYSKDGRAIKATCKRLNIPYTYKGINAFIVPEKP